MNIHAHPTTGTLQARAVVVSLTISQWSGRKLDREITDEVNANHNAKSDAGRYNKLIVPKDALAGVVSAVGAARSEFAKRTLPWKDNGDRIVAGHAFFSLRSWFQKTRSAYEDEVEKFLLAYPGHIATRQLDLGTMFRPEDYPDVSELRHKFDMHMGMRPVESGDDLRIAMSNEQREIIAAEIEGNVQAQVRDAVADVYRRVADVTGRMVERLNAYKPAAKPGDKSEGIFRDSLVGNVRDLIDVLPSLNITGDPRLDDLVRQLEPLAAYDASVLRDNEGARKDTAAEAQKILDTISDWL